ncbi:MAG: hypothetical protein OEY64_07845 [Nitrospinota bacterium]|nr:hypothetical protein [Nitrospinota bacterium]
MISIPGRGETFCKPPHRDWRKIAEENNKKIPSNFFGIDAKSWRSEVFAMALEYMEGLGVEVPVFYPDKPLLLSGHQPYPFHAGVYYKYRLLAGQSELFNPLWISMDTEPSGCFSAKVPSFRERPKIRKLSMLPLGDEAIFYSDAKTDKDRLGKFLEEAFDDLSTIPGGRFEFAEKFLEKVIGERSGNLPGKMRDVMLMLKREYCPELSSGVFELPLSEICMTDNFHIFVYHLIAKGAEVRVAFNSSLANYRRAHQLRSAANPFPDLQAKDGNIETLLWKVEGGERSPLFAKARDGKIYIDANGEMEIDSPEKLKQACLDAGIRIWPRAVALSLLQRLFLGDLFVHGIGGAKYDQVTDEIVSSLFGMTPPVFAVASCTLEVEGLTDPASAISELTQQEREMRFHPEDYLEMTGDTEEVYDEKERLILEIKQEGADKKKLGARISELNDFLIGKLEPEREKLRGRISALEEEAVRYNVLADRELPFFFFSPNCFPE